MPRGEVVTRKGAGVFARKQPTTTAMLLLDRRESRITAYIYNAGAQTVYLANSSTVTTGGHPLLVGEEWEDNVTGDPWYGIVASGTGDIRVYEVS